MRESDGAIGTRKVGGEFGKFAMLVALRDSGCGEERVRARSELAIAPSDAAFGRSGNGSPSRTGAQRTYFND
jgi:hypothetical protein